ncbi:Reverse transcriptase/endonuclease, partial [Giardia duodenalis]
EARHDRRVPVPPRLGEAQPELEIKTHSHLSDQNQKPDIWLVDKCKAVDVGVIQPRQMDAYYNEKVKKYKDGTLPIIYGTDGSLHPKSKRHLEELHVDLCPGCLRHRPHGCKGERAPDEADQTRPGRKPGHPERPPPVILLLTTERIHPWDPTTTIEKGRKTGHTIEWNPNQKRKPR